MNDTIVNVSQPLPPRFLGGKFRPCRWSDIHDRRKPDTWGLEFMPTGKRRYVQVGWQMQVSPFISKAEAQIVCNQLNAQAKP